MVIQVSNLNKKYSEKISLDNITFKLENKFTTIVGESGCGKTTLLKVISGLLNPDSGEIEISGNIVYSKNKNISMKPNKRNLSIVFQDFALWPHMTVYENVAFSFSKSNAEIKEKVMDALELVGLSDFANRKPGQLSGGQQQRVALARAIVPEPKLILFDEALSALDAVLREKMQTDIVQLINKTDSQALFVTHDQNEAMSMSDEIIVMQNGKISQQGTPQEIYRAPQNLYVANFIGKINQYDTNLFIRPENVSLIKTDRTDMSEETYISNTQFTGRNYLNYGFTLQNQQWIFYTEDKISTAAPYILYFSKKDLIHIGGTNEN